MFSSNSGNNRGGTLNFNVFVEGVAIACHHFDNETIRQLLLDGPTASNSTDGICDLIWNVKHRMATIAIPIDNIVNLKP